MGRGDETQEGHLEASGGPAPDTQWGNHYACLQRLYAACPARAHPAAAPQQRACRS